MTTYTGVADANGDFTVGFGGAEYTAGQKVTVTASKDGANKSIELYAPSSPTGGGFLQFSGTLVNFPVNIGVLTLSGVSGVIKTRAMQAQTANNIFRMATGLVIGEGVTSVESFSFADWLSARTLTLPNSLVDISEYAFSTWLYFNTTLTIPVGVKTLGVSSFQSWSSAKHLVIEATISNIPSLCFSSWSVCETITLYQEVPPTITNDTFQNLSGECVFKVPAGSVTAYQTATNWSAFASRIQAI